MKLTLKQRLVRWLTSQKGWVPSGEIQRVVMQSTSYTPANATRRLRELAEENVLEVKQVKGHSFYRIKERVPLLTYGKETWTREKAQELASLEAANEKYWNSI